MKIFSITESSESGSYRCSINSFQRMDEQVKTLFWKNKYEKSEKLGGVGATLSFPKR